MSSTYGIKEVFLTLQGEGQRVGAKSVFVRMTGCNLWSGNPLHRDRGPGPCARWCDTDFIKGEVLQLAELRKRMLDAWGSHRGPEQRWCVLTGGEPALQIDAALVDALREDGWRIAVETNGTIDSSAVRSCDHICVSPKRGTTWPLLDAAHEIKVVLPGATSDGDGWTDAELELLEQRTRAESSTLALFVQPQDPIRSVVEVEQTWLKHTRPLTTDESVTLETQYRNNLDRCIRWVMRHDRWRLSAQLHKYIRIA